MPTLNPYINFSGNTRDAMSFYKEVFGGLLMMQPVGESPVAAQVPESMHTSIMHAALTTGSLTIMGSDMIKSGLIAGNNVSLMLECGSKHEIETLFTQLAEGGQVRDALQEQFWGATFGALMDKFGINWLLNHISGGQKDAS